MRPAIAAAVNRISRYARMAKPTRQGPASVTRALDPVTGLPVWLYRFSGDPVAGAAALDHPHVYRVHEAGRDDEGGFVVAQRVEGASDLASRPEALDDGAAVAATAALAAAGRLGVVHGDMGAHRIQRRGSEVWLEGYGVPWSAGSVADDAARLSRSLVGLAGHALSPAVEAVFQRAAGAAESGAAADTEALARAVAAACSKDSRRAPSHDLDEVFFTPAADAAANADTEEDAETDTDVDAEAGLAAKAGAEPEAPAAEQARAPAPRDEAPSPPRGKAPSPPRGKAPSPPRREAPRPPPAAVTRPVSGPAPVSDTSGAAAPAKRGGFSKRPPPDVSYRSGETPAAPTRSGPSTIERQREGQRQRRRTWLLAALVLLALVLALVTALGRRPVPPPAESGGPVTSIVVDVRLEPASLPPAALVVVASPPGSRLAAGSGLGTVPRRVVFDAAGTWQVQGRFQERLSEVVTFILPAEREVVLRFPPTP